MLDKIKSYWIVISAAGMALLYILLNRSQQKYKDVRLELETIKLQKEVDKIKQKADNAKEGADNAYKTYKDLLDKHPDIKSKLSQS